MIKKTEQKLKYTKEKVDYLKQKLKKKIFLTESKATVKFHT